MQVYIGADHGGFKLAEQLALWGSEHGMAMENLGAFTYDLQDDFVDFAKKVSEKVMTEIIEGRQAAGIVICRSGVGVDIVANKKRFIRCCLGFNEEQVRKARLDCDVNMLALPADYIDISTAKKFVEIFLHTKFIPEERFVRRITKIENMKAL